MYTLRWNDRTNMSMLTDFYELTMSKGYLEHGMADTIAWFDLFFRSIPEDGGYAIMAGVEQMIDYLKTLQFTEENLDYLASTGMFDDRFLDYLRHFKFACDIWAIPEGTPIFPNEPIVKVRGPLIQAQMIETMLLVTINHQSLIATKTSRIVRAAQGRPVFEFGARRAQGYDAAVLGSRAAYIAGVSGTSCTISGEHFGVPLVGTMAHSWVQAFESEYDAFCAYARSFPDSTVLLVDTYNVLKSGIPNAIRAAKDVLEPAGHRLKGIRIDSGDLTYLTVRAREMLDRAGLSDCRITVSNALDEYIIRDLIGQGAAVDAFGVGERLITSRNEPVFGGVYKLAAIEKDGQVLPRMKFSENAGKITNPCSKDVWRFYDLATGKAIADLITLADETIDENKPYELFDPLHTWKRKLVTGFRARRLLEPVFVQGKLVYERVPIETTRNYCAHEIDLLWDSLKRFENPQEYYVDLSQKLWDIKDALLHANKQLI
ncbi:MAG: nicotinate phosphoribosyltransferase [Clostridiaceae bacterium]|jgi:nicotinate phosphoribosyltransferase|nr:nicotinate phosphoribosyltransferase [Clostridiales bacterium]MDD2440898.1 nicotinate phosphoribosyltransferase [Eubacteriales bacterium]MDD4138602.1 nicotinate phosphoribosyltransferase [Eubacteriales bacterium]NLB45231.1 nicotinate phosphoribosyltransferase [Clostridiaceae bacterium]